MKASDHRFYKPWVAAPAAVAVGVGIGVITALTPTIGLGAAVLLLLAVIIIPKPENGVYILAAVLPFEHVTALTSSMSAIKLIGVLVLVGWLKRLYQTRRTFADLGARANLALFMFVAIVALSLAQSQDFSAGLARFTTLILLVSLYFVIGDLAADTNIFQKTLVVLIVSGSLAALWPISQFLLKGGRATGLYSEPSTSAINLLVLVPLAAALLTQSFEPWKRFFYWSALLLLISGVVSTVSRGPMIGLFFIFLILAANKLTDRRLRVGLAALVLVVLLALPFLKFVDPRLSMSGIDASGAAGRYELWSTAQKIFSDHWLLGIGFAGFPRTFLEYASLIPWISPARLIAMVSHNLFIDIAVETGLPGLIAFISFIFLTTRDQLQAARVFINRGDTRHALFVSATLISFTGLLIASLALSTFFLKIFWVALGLQAGARNQSLNG